MPPVPTESRSVADYVDYLERTLLNDAIVHREILPPKPAQHMDSTGHLSPHVQRVLRAAGIERLWTHQDEGIRHLLARRHTVVATPTSSGKTLIFNAAVVSDLLAHPGRCALYVFPLKALEQDQHDELNKLLTNLGGNLTAEIYDGDTKPHLREKIRQNLPDILITTPDMLHSGILAFHEAWQQLFENLNWIVVDELHTYNGIFGSHVLHLFRRINRLAAFYGAEPTYVTCSATIGNPTELAERLFNRPFVAVTESGAPAAKRHFLVVDPLDSGNTVAARLLQNGVMRKLRTLIFTRARVITELIYHWATQNQPHLRQRISSYRAGYMPEERRQIEADLLSGKLLGVVSTSALELGIDIGGLDVCVLVGYPGSIVNTWQRAGRVGRSGRESLIILLAGRDALDQFFVKHPRELFDRDIEDAVADPSNRYILKHHLPCAARELPLSIAEPEYAQLAGYDDTLKELSLSGELLQSADGDVWFAARKQPHRLVNMRAIGESWSIVAGTNGGSGGQRSSPADDHGSSTGPSTSEAAPADRPSDLFSDVGVRPSMARQANPDETRDSTTPVVRDASVNNIPVVDSSIIRAAPSHHSPTVRAGANTDKAPTPIRNLDDRQYTIGKVSSGQLYRECYKGAIYLHRGHQYLIGERNPVKRQIDAHEVDVPYYTRPKQEKETEVIEEIACKPMHGYLAKIGRLKVSSQVIAYEKVAVSDGQVISRHPLESPVETFETVGFWIEMEAPYKKHLKRNGMHHMGSLHATEHATKSLFPLLALSKGTDVGGICYPIHPQLRTGAIFIYDQYPGGIGLAEKGFEMLQRLLELTHAMVSGCDCEEGCPSCIHFPTCGAGNHPLDKAGCIHLLELLTGQRSLEPEALEISDIEDEPPIFADWENDDDDDDDDSAEPEPHIVIFDLETQLSAAEVGGWNKSHLMRISCGIVWDSVEDRFVTYFENDVQELIEHLKRADLVVGFNIIGFDYSVLRGYSLYDFRQLNTFDILREIKNHLNYRVSLNSLAQATLNEPKSADGLMALRWWKQGRLDLIETYCRDDVRLTRDIFRYGLDHGYLLFDRKNEGRMRVPVDWSLVLAPALD
ncbi:MAG: DEAD/DEAH box helicase [Candidatus Latescibacterota bacterium]|nr:DEAD/DEAH box helicase [Candidatus Latescibacterota bacterium]